MLSKLSGSGGRRALWTMVDQGLSSLSTAVMSIAVAKVSSGDDFGRFSLAFVVYTFLIGIARALASTPFIIHHGGEGGDDLQDSGARAAGLAIVLGLVGGGVVIVVAGLFGGQYRAPMIAMSIFMMALLLQDTWRMLLISVGRPAAATLQDSVVIVLQICTFAGCVVTGHTLATHMILAWAVPTALASVFGIFQWGKIPVWNAWREFLTVHWLSSRFMLLEYLAVQGASQLAWLLIPVLGDAKDVAALRGGMTLLGTLNIVGNSVYMFALAETVRRGETRRGPLMKMGMVVTGSIGIITAVVGGTLVLLPESVGYLLLGETWKLAAVTMLPLTLYMIGVSFSTGPQAVMRAIADTRSTFRVNLLLGPALLVCVCLGQYLGKAEGAAWGFAAATVLTAPLWWLMAARSVRRPRRAVQETDDILTVAGGQKR